MHAKERSVVEQGRVQSPRVKRTSVAPCCAPRLDTCSTSFRVMNERRPGTGGCANVQYPHWSRHSLVKGMKTCISRDGNDCQSFERQHVSISTPLSYTISADPSGMRKSYLRGKCDSFVVAISYARRCIVEAQGIFLFPNARQMYEFLRAHIALPGKCL
jgi:hypothetical protein